MTAVGGAAGTQQPRPERLGRSFYNLFGSNLATNLGDGIIRTGAPLLAIGLTTDPLQISLIPALALLPWLLLAIPAGVLVDHMDRRHSLALANAVRVLLAAALFTLFATHSLTIWALYIVVFIDGACETVYDGSIRSMVPGVVPKKLLPAANSRLEAGEVVIQNFIAAPVTSLLFAVSVLIPLGSNIAVYAVAVALAMILPKVASGRQHAAHTVAADGAPRGAFLAPLADGFRFIMANRMLRTLWFSSAFIGFCAAAATSNFVLFLIKGEGLPKSLFGVFMLSGAVGGILGSLSASWFKNRWGAGRTMAIMNLIDCSMMIFVGVVPQIWAAALGFFILSGAVLIWNVLVMSLRQSVIPGRLLGRVHGTWRTLLWGGMPLGSLVGGLLGRISLTLPFIAAGIAATITAIIFFRFLMRLPNPEDVDNGDEPSPAPELGPAGAPLED